MNNDAENAQELSVDIHDMPEGEYVGGTDGHNRYWLTGMQIVRCRDCENLCEHDDAALGTRDKINEHLPPKPTWIIHKGLGGFFCSLSVLTKLVKILIY